jgi:hypothetical protein
MLVAVDEAAEVGGGGVIGGCGVVLEEGHSGSPGGCWRPKVADAWGSFCGLKIRGPGVGGTGFRRFKALEVKGTWGPLCGLEASAAQSRKSPPRVAGAGDWILAAQVASAPMSMAPYSPSLRR